MPSDISAQPATQPEEIGGVLIYRDAIGSEAQVDLVADVRDVLTKAPLVQPMTAWGKPMTVRMSSAGRVGWVIDRGKYRYASNHPETQEPWPSIPASVLDIWAQFSNWPTPPDSCLINWYAPEARMGMHQDKDEGRFDAPVLSISLGDPARFRIGGTKRRDPTVSTTLQSGDVLVMAGAARLAYHGVDRILASQIGSPLLAPGRINLTLRVVDLSIG